ncbi:MAG: bifunctional UDP-N-acetylglucosamine diphosphorylase/glucosamine-1-phosphate N-acetyltransferase GlmU [Solirubrobacteraceae bacterium]
MSAPVVVILAAGQGTRMRSATPKLLHPLCGRTLIGWVVEAARGAGVSRIVVVDGPGEQLRRELAEDVVTVVQQRALGTADALRAAGEVLPPDTTVVVINGDVPLIRPETIRALAAERAATGAAATILTAVLENPTGYGRVLRARDGTVQRVVETKRLQDATAEQLRVQEINAGVYAFDSNALRSALAEVRNNNAQGEYYLPDVLSILSAEGKKVTAMRLDDVAETLGVNDRVQLAQVRAIAQRLIADRLMRSGATIVDPANTVIDFDVSLAPDTRIEPGSALHGATAVGEGSVIGPHSTLIDTVVGSGCQVVHSYLSGARLDDGVSVGPFAYLRPGAVLRDGAKAGTFVEIKNSEVGARSKVPHLSYVGDATIGQDTNLGASTITANYDGVRKHRTVIGNHVHISVDTTLVAPVTVGDDSYTGAGSVITKEVPEGALGIARARQTNIGGYAERVAERLRGKRT